MPYRQTGAKSDRLPRQRDRQNTQINVQTNMRDRDRHDTTHIDGKMYDVFKKKSSAFLGFFSPRFSDNTLSADAWRALAFSLQLQPARTHLVHVILAHAHVNDDLAEALALALGRCQWQHLDLGHNQVGERGARALSRALTANQSALISGPSKKVCTCLRPFVSCVSVFCFAHMGRCESRCCCFFR